MDLQLPRLDGLEATRRLRQMRELSSVAVMAVTAHAMKGDEEKVLTAGCDAYLPKPINTRELVRVVAEVLRQRKEWNDLGQGGLR